MSFKHLNGSFNKFLTNLLGSTKETSFKTKVSKPDFINIIFTDFFEKKFTWPSGATMLHLSFSILDLKDSALGNVKKIFLHNLADFSINKKTICFFLLLIYSTLLHHEEYFAKDVKLELTYYKVFKKLK